MLAQPTFRPHHLALALALTVGWTEVSRAQQPDIQVVENATEEKPKKPRKKTPKPAAESPPLKEVIDQGTTHAAPQSPGNPAPDRMSRTETPISENAQKLADSMRKSALHH